MHPHRLASGVEGGQPPRGVDIRPLAPLIMFHGEKKRNDRLVTCSHIMQDTLYQSFFWWMSIDTFDRNPSQKTHVLYCISRTDLGGWRLLESSFIPTIRRWVITHFGSSALCPFSCLSVYINTFFLNLIFIYPYVYMYNMYTLLQWAPILIDYIF